MAKKAELLEKAAELKLEVSEKNTIAEIEQQLQKLQTQANLTTTKTKTLLLSAKLPSLNLANAAKKPLTKLLKRQRRKLARKLATLLHNQTTPKLT